jgi:hypothetical protein
MKMRANDFEFGPVVLKNRGRVQGREEVRRSLEELEDSKWAWWRVGGVPTELMGLV